MTAEWESPPELLAPDGSIGVRITSEVFSKELCRRFRRPLVSTSINISGATSPRSFDEIDPDLLKAVDYVCLTGRDKPWASKPSTVIKLYVGRSHNYIEEIIYRTG